MPRPARPDKDNWRAGPRCRDNIRKQLKRLALELDIPAEEIADYLLSVGLGCKPFRQVSLPDRTMASGAA